MIQVQVLTQSRLRNQIRVEVSLQLNPQQKTGSPMDTGSSARGADEG